MPLISAHSDSERIIRSYLYAVGSFSFAASTSPSRNSSQADPVVYVPSSSRLPMGTYPAGAPCGLCVAARVVPAFSHELITSSAASHFVSPVDFIRTAPSIRSEPVADIGHRQRRHCPFQSSFEMPG